MNLQGQERERAAEQWLDEGIGHFREAGPRAGLETRILAGLRAQAEQRRRRWAFILAASAAAVLVSAVVASWPRSKPEARPNVVQRTAPAAPTNTASAPGVMANVKQPPKQSHPRVSKPRDVETASVERRPVLRPAVEAREATFPGAAPLTDQGKLLQAYLRQTPQHELVLMAARQRASALASLEPEDLSIAPLEIKDLAPKEAEKDHE